MTNELLATFLRDLVDPTTILGGVAVVLFGLILKTARTYMARKAVDSALWGAAGLVLTKLTENPGGVSAASLAASVGAGYVASVVPDSLKSQGVAASDLAVRVLSRVGQLQAQAK